MDSCLPYTPVASRNWDRMGSFLTGSERERERDRGREPSRLLFAGFPGDWARKLNLGTVPAGSGLFFSPRGQCNNELELGSLCGGSWAGFPGASPVGRLSPGTGRKPPEQAWGHGGKVGCELPLGFLRLLLPSHPPGPPSLCPVFAGIWLVLTLFCCHAGYKGTS